MNMEDHLFSRTLTDKTPRREAVRALGTAGAAFLGAMGLFVTAATGRTRKTKAEKKGKKNKSGSPGPAGPAGPAGPQGPAGTLAGLQPVFVSGQPFPGIVEVAAGSSDSVTMSCPSGGIISGVHIDRRGDVSTLIPAVYSSAGPGSVTVTLEREFTSPQLTVFFVDIVCLMPGTA